MAFGLLDHPMTGIHQNKSRIGRRGASNHIAGVLYVSRGIGDNELAFGCGKIAVGHVYSDTLLALIS